MSTFGGGRCLGGTRPLRGRLTIGSSMDPQELDNRVPVAEDKRHAVARSITLERLGAPAAPAHPNMFTAPRGRHVVRTQPTPSALRRRGGTDSGEDWPKKHGGSGRPGDSRTSIALPTWEDAHRAARGACAHPGVRRASRQSWAYSATRSTRSVRCGTCEGPASETGSAIVKIKIGRRSAS